MYLLSKYKYKLETHLKVLCEENSEYENLNSAWILGKRSYRNILNTIQHNYPHYSLHDESHSESIITNIEMLLGEERIKKLSPTDTWLILNSAYLHDFGMALLYKNVEMAWNSKEFTDYLHRLTEVHNQELREAAKYIVDFKKNINDIENEWPLKVRKYTTEIIADYFRGKHAKISKEYLNNIKEWGLDLTQNGLIQNRLIELIGDIAFLHTQNFGDIMKLEYISNGYNSDYIYPRFIAELIRLGDLLDLDNGRFNEQLEKVTGNMPRVSAVHKAKHRGTKHVLVTPEKIEVKINCENENVYREARNWLNWIEEELKNITLEWTEIVPEELNWYAPKLTKKELLLKGKPDKNNLSNLKFEISQEKSFEIIEGSNIYEDKLVFLREFIQNAIDASKVQLWRDLNDGLYDAWLKPKLLEKLSEITPFDITEEIYNNYKINIDFKELENGEIEVRIKDNGIGISLETLQKMCNVGESYSNMEMVKKEIANMPTWLIPTGGFGVGVQSAFLVTDKFIAYTKPVSRNSLKIEFEPTKLNGYISVRDTEQKIRKGTEMIIIVPKIKNIKYQIGGSVSEFIEGKYDPFSTNNLTMYSLIDYVNLNIQSTFFKLQIDAGERRIENTENKYKKLFENNNINKENYLYYISENLEYIHLWDKKNSAYLYIDIKNIYQGSYEIFFKGCALKKETKGARKGINIIVDIYGFNTKETLKLDRSELTKNGKDKLKNIINDGIIFYLKEIKKVLDSDIDKEEEYKFNLLNFIILSEKYSLKDVSIERYKSISWDDKLKVKGLKKTGGSYGLKNFTSKDILNEYSNMSYLTNDYILRHVQFKNENYDNLSEILCGAKIDKTLIICDTNFIGRLEEFPFNYVDVLDEDKELFLYMVNFNETTVKSINVNEKTEKYFLKNLVKDKDAKYYGENRVRSSIPGISKYEKLVLKEWNTPSMYSFRNSKSKIISPITKNDKSELEKMANKEMFVNSIVIRQDYQNLLKYTVENQLVGGQFTENEISEEYKRLIGDYFDLVNDNGL